VFGPPISQSVPHIYLSGLPFAPIKSQVAQRYLPLFPKTLHLKTGKTYDWPAIIGVFEGHTDWVWSVAFSQDGRRIVSGSHDNTIRVWDAETGEVVAGPLQGHTNSVRSVAFSQDGSRIVSCSGDATIRVWDAETGDVVAGPLQGHTDWVNSVAFSQDGRRIVSGSGDNTIRVWDAETGDIVAGPLQGHTDWVRSVAFSQDGRRIVSGSGDNTIRVWNAETGDVVTGPLQGHTNWVNSVAFSQDGGCIVSGSDDQTIRVYDAHVVSDSDDAITNRFFKDGSRLEGGWILNSSSELLFWLPSWNRTTLCWPRNPFVIGGGADESTQLDFNNFVHGRTWEQCKA
jgi:WD40 repeat protein